MAGLHLLKLCVGVERPEQLHEWQTQRLATATELNHTTRMWPRREAELLDGGSLYWVMKGAIQARQRIIRLDEVTGADGIRRCKIVLHRDLVRVTSAPKRAFQGWRYLKAEDAPRDLGIVGGAEDALPDELREALGEIGVL
ncbi:MAG: DUF1489 family protein [Pikeienuella sp.]